MASVSEQRAAFDEVASLLRSAAATNARTCGTAVTRSRLGAGAAVRAHGGPLALLYGCGMYENLSTIEIVQAAALDELERHHP